MAWRLKPVPGGGVDMATAWCADAGRDANIKTFFDFNPKGFKKLADNLNNGGALLTTG
jgi:hypothetical protein